MKAFIILLGMLLRTNHCCVKSFRSSLITPQGKSHHATVTTKASALLPALAMSTPVDSTSEKGFIETELRGAAMKLHTRSQSPKEGEAKEIKMEPYVTTHDDYVLFLVDSQYVYQAFEDVINSVEELSVFSNSPLDRTTVLESDIEYMVKEFQIEKPDVGKAGLEYADVIRQLGNNGDINQFICHYYNFYFAHTAGGRMIGKKLSSLLLNKKTLDFYKWDGDLNKIKKDVKIDIENIVKSWSVAEKKKCTDATAAAFKGGGAINNCLSGGQ